MQAFRRKGYFAASIKDLEEATGLKGGSIYNSYGDKSGLFQAAIAHYNRVVLSRRIASHAPGAAGLDGLHSLFVSLLHEPNGETFGCLITNSAIEFGGGNNVPAGVGEGLRVLSKTFADRLQAARRAGLLRNNVELGPEALKLVALYQGVLVLVRAGWDKKTLETLINDEFKQLGVTEHDA